MSSSSSSGKRSIRRPWDKRAMVQRKKHGLPLPTTAATAAGIPFVEVPTTADGGVVEKFFSDCLYLNTSIYDEEPQQTGGTTRSTTTTTTTTCSAACRCGVREPPPLLSRSKLVQSLDLKAAILATFSLEPRAMAQEFPSLLGPDATVPTLVLHGKKGWTVESLRLGGEAGVKKAKTNGTPSRDDDDGDDEPESVPLHDEFSSTPSGSDDDDDDDDETYCGCSIGTQDEAAVETSKKYAHIKAFASPSPVKVVPLSEQVRPQPSPKEPRPFFPATVHFSEITPTWLPPEELRSNNNNRPSSPLLYSHIVDPETGALRSWIVQERIYCRGVHHPKYMILFERDGSVVVVVTTSNLSAQVSTEGSWIQRFPPVTTSSSTSTNCDGSSDLGAVLSNFLHCQMLATAPGQLTAHAFVQRYLNWKSLADLERLFDYSRAQVHLIATVPGNHEGRHSAVARQAYSDCDERSRHQQSKSNNKSVSRKYLYGPQRIAHVLAQRKIPASLQHDSDRLIFQPTSFGGDWDPRSLAHLVRSYLGYDDPGASPIRDVDVLQRLDIVWPTDYFVRQLSKYIPDHSNQSSGVAPAADVSLGFASFAEAVRDTKVDPEKENGGKIFFSAESFNRLHWDCLSRMVMYESSVPAQRPILLTPHFKSVARLFDGKSDYRIRKEMGVPKSEAYFSWFLLTSACLSRGAQGEREAVTRQRVPGSDAQSYANFELGVLFTSRRDRLYCWKPMSCCCSAATTNATTRLIHVPSPYCFRPAPYVAHEDDEEFCETPYFHEILRDNACTGNLLATPYGKALAQQYANEQR